jgi:ABC-type branched-subunit amino acid transport system substrate-binding protein
MMINRRTFHAILGRQEGKRGNVGNWIPFKRVLLVVLFLVVQSADLPAESVCPPDSHVFGMSTALTGPTANLGINMRNGVLAAFDEMNAQGGVQGKSSCLIALDDGYEPARAVPNMHTLIDRPELLAIIGNVGTPTAVAAVPIANRRRTPFFGAYTGAGVLRKTPPDRYVINYRASYAEETAAMVDALIQFGGLRPEEIAFFTQRDAYGDAGYAGGISALKKNGLKNENDIAHGRYERNTMAVENGLADILLVEPEPKAVILVGTYAPCAEFIRLSRKNGLDALFLNVSFVGAAPLAAELGSYGDGVIVTQVVPHFDSDLPVVKNFRNALLQFNPSLEPTFGALEGYIVGRIMLQTLQKMESEPTRESIIDTLEGMGDFHIGLGNPLHLDKEEHQACHYIWPTIIQKGKVVPFQWEQLRKKK